jgi:hypothetical protein
MAKKQTKTHTTKGIKPPKHHSRNAALKVYWPYLPMIILLIGGMFLNIWQPLQSNQTATLAYATEMSRNGLLSGTNTQRANNGAAGLSINSQLNAAAQAKAQDMVDRDYWSHETPDGEQPWIFIDAQGYNYQKAGENLAYGFSTSNETITGWMNSPSHKANMLDVTFSEVGFGFANSANFVDTGEETVVVAMYANPVDTAPAPPAPTPEPQPQTKPSTVGQATPEPPVEEPPVKEEITEEIAIVEDTVMPVDNLPTTTDTPTVERESQRITLAQQLTNGSAPWIAVALSSVGFGLAMLWLVKHFVLVRKYIIEGEHFVAHHPLLDLIVVIIIAIVIFLSQSTGVII